MGCLPSAFRPRRWPSRFRAGHVVAPQPHDLALITLAPTSAVVTFGAVNRHVIMPSPGSLRSRTNDTVKAPTVQHCNICHQELNLVLRHVSPLSLGPPVTLEFYECSECTSFSVLRWTVADGPERRISTPDRRRNARHDRRGADR